MAHLDGAVADRVGHLGRADDEREVRLRLRRLLLQRDHPVPVELGDAEVLRVGHRGEEDERVGRAALEALDEVDDAALEQVVAAGT